MTSSSAQSTPPGVDNVLQGIRDYLRYQKECGVDRIDRSNPRPKPTAQPATLPASIPQEAPVPDRPDAPPSLEDIVAQVAACTRCPLHKERTNTVPGQGSSNPEIMFVGEGPGAEEDAQGLPFVGRSGKLLTSMIEAMGLSREDVFIGNIVKCRPPGNRAPTPDEMAACMPYLKAQIRLLKPKVIVALGATSVKGLVETSTGITKLRGTWLSFEGIDLMPTFHPAYLLRDPSKKKPAWEDLQEVLRRVGREVPR